MFGTEWLTLSLLVQWWWNCFDHQMDATVKFSSCCSSTCWMKWIVVELPLLGSSGLLGMLHWIFSTGKNISPVSCFFCCCHVPFFLCVDCAVREWLLELECLGIWRLFEINLYGSRSVFALLACFLVSYRRFTFLSLQVLGPSSVGLPVHKLAWTVWRQVTHWTDEVYGSFQWSCLESSAQVGCFLTSFDDFRSAGGAANRDSRMHLHAERVAWCLED